MQPGPYAQLAQSELLRRRTAVAVSCPTVRRQDVSIDFGYRRTHRQTADGAARHLSPPERQLAQCSPVHILQYRAPTPVPLCHPSAAKPLRDYTSDKQKQTPWPLVRKRTIPTERPPLVSEILCQPLWIERCRVVSAADPPQSLISVF
jgi:hypothetical protein